MRWDLQSHNEVYLLLCIVLANDSFSVINIYTGMTATIL